VPRSGPRALRQATTSAQMVEKRSRLLLSFKRQDEKRTCIVRDRTEPHAAQLELRIWCKRGLEHQAGRIVDRTMPARISRDTSLAMSLLRYWRDTGAVCASSSQASFSVPQPGGHDSSRCQNTVDPVDAVVCRFAVREADPQR